MRSLVIAIGNRWRRDDGVAHAVVERLLPTRGVVRRGLQQLTPEIAAEIAPYDNVVFVDADAASTEFRIEPVGPHASTRPLTHVSSPSEIVQLAETVFGFAGRASYCRIPASDFSFGEGLSHRTESFARKAAAELEVILS